MLWAPFALSLQALLYFAVLLKLRWLPVVASSLKHHNAKSRQGLFVLSRAQHHRLAYLKKVKMYNLWRIRKDQLVPNLL